MLTSALPVSINGQTPSSPMNITTSRPTVVSSKPSSVLTSVTALPASTGTVQIDGHDGTKYHHIWLVTGPAGCGKSTVAEFLANALDIPYIEGDKVRLDSHSRHEEAAID
jgi:gluconokinase